MKKNKIILRVLMIIFCVGSFSVFAPNALGATCAGGDGCVAGCVPIPDPDCPDCASVPGSAGLVPCGKSMDDPDTTKWNECDACTPCSLILMGQLIIEFLVKIAAILALLSIALAGFFYIFAAGNVGAIEKAKSIMKHTLLGFVLVFIAWAVVDSMLITMGYIDPIGGEWYVVDC